MGFKKKFYSLFSSNERVLFQNLLENLKKKEDFINRKIFQPGNSERMNGVFFFVMGNFSYKNDENSKVFEFMSTIIKVLEILFILLNYNTL